MLLFARHDQRKQALRVVSHRTIHSNCNSTYLSTLTKFQSPPFPLQASSPLIANHLAFHHVCAHEFMISFQLLAWLRLDWIQMHSLCYVTLTPNPFPSDANPHAFVLFSCNGILFVVTLLSMLWWIFRPWGSEAMSFWRYSMSSSCNIL